MHSSLPERVITSFRASASNFRSSPWLCRKSRRRAAESANNEQDLNPKERILETIFRIGMRSRNSVLRSSAQNCFATQSTYLRTYHCVAAPLGDQPADQRRGAAAIENAADAVGGAKCLAEWAALPENEGTFWTKIFVGLLLLQIRGGVLMARAPATNAKGRLRELIDRYANARRRRRDGPAGNVFGGPH